MLIHGNALHLPLRDESVQCVVTSPPYWGLRNYGIDSQLGLEPTPEAYVANMVQVFREVRRVLKDDGTCWLNLGDSYARMQEGNVPQSKNKECVPPVMAGRVKNAGLKPKDIVGIPWRVAFALQADGWWLRSDIIWAKPNPMPESVTDRPTRSHEYLFLLTKRARYHYNAAAIRTPGPVTERFHGAYNPPGGNGNAKRNGRTDKQRGHSRRHDGFNARWDAMEKAEQQVNGANARSVWSIVTEPYSGAHFATFPQALVTPCILAGSRPGDVVLDPFTGSGTVGVVCRKTQRRFVGIDLSMDYLRQAQVRVENKEVGVKTEGLPLFEGGER